MGGASRPRPITGSVLKNIQIYIACGNGSVEISTVVSLLEEQAAISAAGHIVNVNLYPGDALIGRFRDMAVAKFLNETDGTDFVFIDADVGWSPGDVLKLCEYPVDVVCGAYRKRSDPEEYMVSFLDRPYLVTDGETGLLEVDKALGGFTRLSRACLERMRDHCTPYKMAGGGTAWEMFPCGVYEGEYWGEDSSFFRIWREIGGQVWVDANLNLSHTGKKTFTGNFAEWLVNSSKAQTGKEVFEQYADYVEAAE